MRDHGYPDREFNSPRYDPDDQGEFIPGLVFVIMPFSGEASAEVYSAIKDECCKLGLNAKRADESAGSAIVLRELTKLIEDAEFIICDLSRQRPNVYYELGYAHGVGNEALDILLIARRGTRLQFDVAPLRVQYYESTEHLRTILNSQLKRMIELTRR